MFQIVTMAQNGQNSLVVQNGPNLKMAEVDKISKWPKFVKMTQSGQNFQMCEKSQGGSN